MDAAESEDLQGIEFALLMGADINWNNANWVNLQCTVMYILFIDSPCMQKVACIIVSYNLIMVKEFLNEIT